MSMLRSGVLVVLAFLGPAVLSGVASTQTPIEPATPHRPTLAEEPRRAVPEVIQSRAALIDKGNLSRVPTGAMDLGIAAGPVSVLETSNYGVALVAKDGQEIARTELYRFFRPVQTSPGEFANDYESANDVDSMFDWDSERFFVSAVARNAGGNEDCRPDCEAWEYLAVSKTSNPQSFTLDDWFLYELPVTPSRGEPVSYWSDGTRIAASKQFLGYHAEIYRFNRRETEVDDKIRVLDKRRLIRGQKARWTEFRDIDDLSRRWLEGYVMPEQLTPSRTLFAAQLNGCTGPKDHHSRIMILGFDGRRRKPRLTTKKITIESPVGCGGPIKSPQPGDATPIQNYSSPFGVYRDGSIWLAQTVGRRLRGEEVSAIRVVEVDVSRWPERISLETDMVLARPGDWNGFPAIGVDAGGNVLVVHSSTGPRQFPSVEFTWSTPRPVRRLRPSRPLKTGQTFFEPPGAVTKFGNMVSFADYYAASVDPTDDTIWIIGQYAEFTHRATAWVGRIGFRSR